MALSLRSGLCAYGSYKMGMEKREMVSGSSDVLAWKSEFKGSQVLLREQSDSQRWGPKGAYQHLSIHAQASICVPKALRWWDKTITTNMIEIKSTHQLVRTLLDAEDKLVIVDFYSPGCGGCRALHPKICQLAEQYPNAIFLKVNYEEHRSMCQGLNIHVLPFFRFYRGAQGRVSSFSCTNSTIKKFKDALAKHSTERCSLGPARGLEESELMSLASNRENNFSFPLKSTVSRDLALAAGIDSTYFLGEVEKELSMASMH